MAPSLSVVDMWVIESVSVRSLLMSYAMSCIFKLNVRLGPRSYSDNANRQN
jgi:hypothetical protein